jgi:hypothetical protein
MIINTFIIIIIIIIFNNYKVLHNSILTEISNRQFFRIILHNTIPIITTLLTHQFRKFLLLPSIKSGQ